MPQNETSAPQFQNESGPNDEFSTPPRHFAGPTESARYATGGSVTITVPLAPLEPEDNRRWHVDAHLTAQESEVFEMIAAGLDQANARLTHGRHVITCGDVVRWLIEQINDAWAIHREAA